MILVNADFLAKLHAGTVTIDKVQSPPRAWQEEKHDRFLAGLKQQTAPAAKT